MDYNQFNPVEQAEMASCVMPVLFKCFDTKPIGTDLVKMGMFRGCVLAVKVDGNTATFALPFNGPMGLLKEYLTKEERAGRQCLRHYNKTDSIIYNFDVNDDNTELTMSFYTKEFKMF